MAIESERIALMRVEASERWVRGQVDGEFVVDSKRALLVWEHEKYPSYFFPREDLRMDWFVQAAQTDSRTLWHIQHNGQLIERAAYQVQNQPELEDYFAFFWHKLEHWYEEEEEVFVHARDPYKRVDSMPSSRHLRVELDGVTLAETKRPTLLFETSLPTRYYIPQADVKMAYLKATDSHTRCPYKGIASYWDVFIGDKLHKDFVWSYPDPIAECPKIKGLLCFYNEKVDLYVDGELQERPKSYWS